MIKKMWACIFNKKIKSCYIKGTVHNKFFINKKDAKTWWKEHYYGEPDIKPVLVTDRDPFENMRKELYKIQVFEFLPKQMGKSILNDFYKAIQKDLKNWDEGAE